MENLTFKKKNILSDIVYYYGTTDFIFNYVLIWHNRFHLSSLGLTFKHFNNLYTDITSNGSSLSQGEVYFPCEDAHIMYTFFYESMSDCQIRQCVTDV